MKRRFVVFLLISLLSISAIYATITPIGTIQDNFDDYNNQIVTVEGVVTVGLNILATAGSESYLQDNSGKGIRLDDISSQIYTDNIVKGNKLRITGKVVQLFGYTRLTDFSSFEVLDTNIERPYTELTLVEAADYQTWQCSFVKISGILAISQVGSNRLILSDTQGNEVFVQIANSTGIIIEDSDIGEMVSVYGVVKFLQEQTLVYPGYQEDVGLTITKPIISEISHTPTQAYNDQEISVSAKVIDLDGSIQEVLVMYKADFETNFTSAIMNLTINDIYSGTIPAYDTHASNTGNYVYKIYAKDNDNNTVESNEKNITINERPIVTPIADIYADYTNYENQTVIINGIITIGAGTIHNSILRAYIQDESEKGIQVFMPSASAHITGLARGNKVTMTGVISEYEGVKQITNISYEVIGTEDLPDIPLTINEAMNHQIWESTFVNISGKLTEAPFWVGGGHNITLKDDAGSTITVRVWDTTGINVSKLRANVPVKAYGIISVYNTRSQLVPGSQEDISILIQEPQFEEISFSPLKPFIDEEITINASVFDYDGVIDSVFIEYRTDKEIDFNSENKFRMALAGDIYRYDLPAYNTLHNDEGEFLIRVTAYDDSLNRAVSPIKKINVYKRRPIIENIRFMNSPSVNDTLIVRAKIYDTDGYITQAKLFYTLNYHQTINEVMMNEVSIDTAGVYNIYEFEGLIPGQKSGTMVYVSVWAEDDSSFTSIQKFDDANEEIRYVYPVYEMTATLKIPPKVANTFNGDVVEIGYFAKSGDKVIVRIYNSEGKLMATPINKISDKPDGINFYYWNGRNKDFRLVEPGLYICHLEVQDRETGKKKTSKAPIVIGTRLK